MVRGETGRDHGRGRISRRLPIKKGDRILEVMKSTRQTVLRQSVRELGRKGLNVLVRNAVQGEEIVPAMPCLKKVARVEGMPEKRGLRIEIFRSEPVNLILMGELVLIQLLEEGVVLRGIEKAAGLGIKRACSRG